MQAGRLRQRLTIQQSTEVTSDSGQVTHTWSIWKQWWGEYVGRGGRELLQAEQIKGESNSLFRIRYCSGLTPQHRIVWNGRNFDINNITDPDGRFREMLLSVKEAVA